MKDLITDIKSLELETIKNLRTQNQLIHLEHINLIIMIFHYSVPKMVYKQCQHNQKF